MKKYFKKKGEKEPWQIAAARYCVTNSGKFTKEGLFKHIKFSYDVNKVHLQHFYEEEIEKPAGRDYSRRYLSTKEGGVWTAPLDLVSKVTDYDGLQQARDSSRKAMYIATGSLIMAIIVGIVQICTSICR